MMDNKNNTFGHTIKQARMALNMPLKDAADRMGIQKNYLYILEANYAGNIPREGLLIAMSNVLNLNLETLKDLATTINKNDSTVMRQSMVVTKTQNDLLWRLANRIQWNGKKKPRRITSNTVVRCLINLLEDFDADISRISTEKQLSELFQSHFGSMPQLPEKVQNLPQVMHKKPSVFRSLAQWFR